MNIVLATDNNFVRHCSVVIRSILMHNESVNIFILTEGLNEENEHYLSGLGKDNSTVSIVNVPKSLVDDLPMSKHAAAHLSIATYYRLFVTSLLPENVDKVIYLDCDMVILSSLQDLWNIDISDYALGAVYQNFEWSDYYCSWERLNIPREMGYFNAGTLLMNLAYMRKNDFQKQAIEFIRNHQEQIISHDQDVLNALFHGKALPISCRWNFTPLFDSYKYKKYKFPNIYSRFIEERKSKDFKPVIIHFASKPKPWDYGCLSSYRGYYYEYLDKEHWGECIPKRNIKNWVKYNFINKIKDLILECDFTGILMKRKRKQLGLLEQKQTFM